MFTDLKQTIDLMNSEDHKDQLKAEYWQAKIRRDRLEETLVRLEAGTMTLPTNCSVLLMQQKEHMDMYLHDLAVRAEILGIELD